MKSDPFDPNRGAKKKRWDVEQIHASREAELEARGAERIRRRGPGAQAEVDRILRGNKPPQIAKLADGGMLDLGQQRRRSNLALDKTEFDADTTMMNAQVRRANADASRNYKMAVLAKSKMRMAEPATQEGMLSSIGRKAKAFFAADGGMVEGPGGPTDDMVPAMYSAGEYVLPADTVQAVGKENLDSLRRMTHTKAKKKSKVKGDVIHAADGFYLDRQDAERKRKADAETELAARPAAYGTGAMLRPGAQPAYGAEATDAIKRLTTGPVLPVSSERPNLYNRAGKSLDDAVPFNMMAPENKTQNFAKPLEAKVLEYNGPNLIDDTPRNITASQGVATDRSGETEAERKANISDIDSQLFGLRGNVNMASKRQMVTGLLGLKRQLTADRMGQLGDADKLATGVSSDNAQMRQGADQFNTGTKLDIEKFNVGAKNENSEGLRRAQSEAMKLAAANDPNSLDNQLKVRADARAENVDARAGDIYNLQREGKLNADARTEIERIKKSTGITDDTLAAAIYSRNQEEAGRRDTTSVPGVQGENVRQAVFDSVVNKGVARTGIPAVDAFNKYSQPDVAGVPVEDTVIDEGGQPLIGNPLGVARRISNAVLGTDYATDRGYAKDPESDKVARFDLSPSQTRALKRDQALRRKNQKREDEANAGSE